MKTLFSKLILLSIYSIFAVSSAFAELKGHAKIDSLLNELPRQKEDTNKVNVLNALSSLYYTINADSDNIYGQLALALATRLDWKKGIARANSYLGTNYYSESDYPRAQEYNLKALKIYEEMGNKVCVAQLAGNIGGIYAVQSDYPHALEYLFKSLKMAEEIEDKNTASIATGNIGNVYKDQSDYPHALEYFLKALKMADEIGNKNNAAYIDENIGALDELLLNPSAALEYYLKALQIYEEFGNKSDMARASGNISEIYTSLKNYRLALLYAKKGLTSDQEVGDMRLEAYASLAIGGVYLHLVEDPVQKKKSNKARNTYEKKNENDFPDEAITPDQHSRLQLAIYYFRRAMELAKKIHVPDLVSNSFNDLSIAYQLNGQYKEALESYQNYIVIKDSIFTKENDKKIIQQQFKYDYSKREDSTALVNAKKEKAAALKFERQRNYTYMGIAGIMLLMLFSFFIVKERGKSERERKKSDDLLLNILPAEVAKELKATGGSAARHFDHVTVLFTDFVNFTQAGEKMSPQGLLDELHECFKTFDNITAKYNIEKIKTIGDAYLAVCGLPLPNPKHAGNIILAAIEINQFMAARFAHLGDKSFQIRIGVHSGSVVAGIVGVKKFAYDIWGDTVNTAARMEQNSEPGKINISESTYELVKAQFNCEYRGEIEAKNKGKMKMYYVDNM